MIGINKYYDVERERVLLRFVITAQEQRFFLQQLISGKFYDRVHSHLVKIIRHMDSEDRVISFTSVRDYIRLNELDINQKRVIEGFKLVYYQKGTCRFTEDLQYLDELFKNRLIDNEIINKTKKLLDENAGATEIIQHVQNSLAKVIVDKSESVEETAQNAKDAIRKAQQEGQSSLKTGLKEFDQTVGISKKRYFVVAALSSVGKSFWSYDILLRLCEYNEWSEIAIIYFSLEISKEDFIYWLACNLASVTFRRLEGGDRKLTEEEMRRVEEALEYVKKLPLKIISGPNTTNDVMLKTQKFVLDNKNKHVVLFLDHHLKVVKEERTPTRDHIMQLSSVIAGLAKNYNITSILLAQLKRDLLKKEYEESEHRPSSWFIQESGSLYQDADHVICLWRPEIYRNPIHLPPVHDMHMIVEKNKNGQKDFDIILECCPKYGQLFNKGEEAAFEESKSNQWDSAGIFDSESQENDELPF